MGATVEVLPSAGLREAVAALWQSIPMFAAIFLPLQHSSVYMIYVPVYVHYTINLPQDSLIFAITAFR